MSFKRSWSRRLAVVLSAVTVMSSASPVTVPVMAAEDIINGTQQEAITDEVDAAENGTDTVENTAGDIESASLPDEDINEQVTDEQLTEEGSPLASDEDMLSDTETTGLVEGSDSLIEEPEAASDGTYSGALRLNTVNAGLLKTIGYRFDDGEFRYVDITSDGLKAQISFTGAKKVSFCLSDNSPIDYSTIPLNDGSDGYRVDFYVDGYDGYGEKKHINSIYNNEVTFELKEYGFIQNGIFKVNIDTQLNRECKKRGNLIIHVAHENPIPGTDKIISINKVNVQFGNYAIAYDVSGNIIPGEYRNTPSVNNIGDAGYGGTITLPYWCAKDATITIEDTDAESGNEENGMRYAYTVGDDFFYSTTATSVDAGKRKYKCDLAYGIDTDTEITIGAKRVADPEVKFVTSSNNILQKFKVESNDGCGTSIYQDIDASSDGVKLQVFEKARELTFKYGYFTAKAGASAAYDRGSGNPANWVYRIEYRDTKGEEVSKTLFTSSDEWKIKIDDNDRFPEEIKVSAIPNVKVTLKATGTKDYTRNINDIFSKVTWRDENGRVYPDEHVSSGEYSLWVEPGKTVWIQNIEGARPYIFPYIENAAQAYMEEDSILQFTLPKVTEDTVFDVSFYEFDLDNKDLITVTNGTRSDDGQQGKAVVSINGLGGYGASFTDTDTSSELYDHKVLGAEIKYKYNDGEDHYYHERQLEVSIKMDSTETLEYAFDRISYDKYDLYDTGSVYSIPPLNTYRIDLTPKEGEYVPSVDYNSNFKVTKDMQGNNIATVYIPTRCALFKLIKDGSIDLTVAECENNRLSSVELTEGTSGTIKTASAMTGGEYRCAINRAGISTKNENIPYGSEVSLKAEPAEGFKLSGIDITCPSNSANNITVTDEKDLAALTGDKGYSFKLYEGVKVTFTTEPVYCAVLRYKTGSDEPKLQGGKYIIDHKRPVEVRYKKGNATPASYSCDILVGSQKITSNEGISKAGDSYIIDANKGDLAGKNVTFKFYTGDGGKTDESLRTLVLAFDKANTGVKFGSDKYSVPLGAEKEIPVSITGSFEAAAILASDKTYDKNGLDIKLDISKKKLIFKSTNDSKADIYTVNIVNSNDKNVVYGSVKVELETSAVKAAPAPVVQIIGTTNRGVTVGLKAQKIDTKIKGLCYELQVKTKDQKKGYFKTSRGVETGDKIYVPVTTSSIYVDMFTDSAASASQYAGDPDAVFVATARLIQLRSDNKTVIIGSDNWSDEKNGIFSTKEGDRYETKLRLKKISKGTIYNTMSSGNAYRIGVVYSKKTAIQRLDRTKLRLLTGSGEEVTYPEGKSMEDYLEIGDDYTILFHPGGRGSVKLDYADKLEFLSPGTYMIKAYALEPDALEVCASVKVKVEKGISALDLEDVPGVIYKQPGKAASLQLTAIGKIEDHLYKDSGTRLSISEFVTKKVRYEITEENNTGGLVKIGKNGKITINKKLEPGNTSIKVRVIADDFARNPGMEEICSDEKTIQIRSPYGADALNLAYSAATLNVASGEYEHNFYVEPFNRLENSYYLSDLTYYDGYSDACMSQFWVTVYERNKGDHKNYYVPVRFKVSGAGKLLETKSINIQDNNGTNCYCARIEVKDIDRDIKISAYAADNSGRKIKDYRVRINSPDGKLGVSIHDGYIYPGSSNLQNMLDWEYGNTDIKFDSYAMEKDGIAINIQSEFYDKNVLRYSAVKYRISSVKGGRVSNISFYQSRIYPTAAQTTFTITDLQTKKDYKVTINNKGYVDGSKKTRVTASNSLYDAKKGKKAVEGQIYSHLDFSSTSNYMDYDDVLWNTVRFHVDSAEKDQYVMVRVVSSVKRVGGVYKVVTKPLGNSLNTLMESQSEELRRESENEWEKKGILRDGASYPIKLTGKDFTVEFYDRVTKKFDIAPGSYKLIITPVVREGVFKYRTLAAPATVTLKVVAPPKASVKPNSSITFGTSEGTVTKGDYSNFLASPVYKEQGILYKELKNLNNDGKMNGFRSDFRITDQRTGKIEYVGSEPIGIKDKDRNLKLQGWLILEYQQVDGTVVEEPVKVKINTKGEVKKK